LIFIEEAPVSAPPTWPLGSSLIFFDGAVDRGLLLPVCGSVLRLAAAFGPFAFAVVVAVTSWNGEGCPGSLSFNDFEGCSCPDGATRLAEDETFSFSFSLGGSSEAMAASVSSLTRRRKGEKKMCPMGLEDGFTAAERCAKRLARQSRARRDARGERYLTLGEQVLRNPLIRDLSIQGLNPYKLSELSSVAHAERGRVARA